jgi:hypothetical protein
MDLQNIHYIGDLVTKKLEVDECLETWLKLMKGYKGSMWGNMFMAYVVQVIYIYIYECL